MRYYVTLDPSPDDAPLDDAYGVDLLDLPNGALAVSVDGQPIDVDAVASGDRLSLRIAGRVLDVAADGKPPFFAVFAGGRGRSVRVESERTRSAERPPNRRSAGENIVRSPMPGRVVRVLVTEGETVQPGQGLVVLEAMKMENEVRARSAGVVSRLHVAAGTAVDANAPLVTVG